MVVKYIQAIAILLAVLNLLLLFRELLSEDKYKKETEKLYEDLKEAQQKREQSIDAWEAERKVKRREEKFL